jgi:hypothetical protein
MGKVVPLFALLLFALPVGAKDLYISQNGAGDRSGLNGCSNASTPAWFNSTASWGSGPQQIGPGTTVHLCGTFTGAPGQQLLVVRGDGTSTSPITIKFDSGALLTAPYWSAMGAIFMQGRSYITVDGGGSGVIRNTASGTNLQYKQDTRAIYAPGCTGCVIQNLAIADLYVHTSVSDSAVRQTAVNCVYWVGSDNLTINRVTCHDVGWAFAGNGNNFTLENSEIYNVDHGVAFGASGKTSGFTVHDNHFHDYTNWDTTTNAYHHDGLHFWGQNGGIVTNGTIYNNLFDGDSGVNITAHIYLQDSVDNVAVYNNVFIEPDNRTNIVLWFNGQTGSTPLLGGPATGNSAYNNFIKAGGHSRGSGIYALSQFNFTACNNVLLGGNSDISVQGGGSLSSTGIDYNVYEDLLADAGIRNALAFQGHNYNVLADWQAACHCDQHAKLVPASKINAGSLGQLLSGSAAINSAANLMSITSGPLAPLARDKAGALRQVSGNWDAGAYKFGSVPLPAAPSGVVATVQ